ncbi:hypothetical protein HRTV-25_gp17 [Halorubrum tailed virus 25]|uniref:Uncharacterized protein n=1 Tax=Halorubrum tailed virus 25 TaxID=2878006 RepID=A0AAE9BY07_9CAUD|nr:hypothetical protein M1M37_gp017 [Halorubrum tailed virus 25]UBF22598.1 hypothetical protein HRTV-25_gp17 [Halorubrum tailed virus 25]
MAVDDSTLKAEVRALTDYGTAIISESDLQEVVDLTKRELHADIGDDSFDLYEDLNAERALFWLTCIFLKVKSGEIDAPSFSISELSVRQSNFTERHGIWMDNFRKHYRAMDGGAPVGHTKANRPDRNYDFDNSSTSNTL